MSTPNDLTRPHFTPYELGILLHYFVSPEEHPRAPIFEATCLRLMQLGLMTRDLRREPVYGLTERGEAFITLGLLRTPIPEQVWQMPAGGCR